VRPSLNSQFRMRLRNSLHKIIFKTLLNAVFKIIFIRPMALMKNGNFDVWFPKKQFSNFHSAPLSENFHVFNEFLGHFED